jgi:hypothetical protein
VPPTSQFIDDPAFPAIKSNGVSIESSHETSVTENRFLVHPASSIIIIFLLIMFHIFLSFVINLIEMRYAIDSN